MIKTMLIGCVLFAVIILLVNLGEQTETARRAGLTVEERTAEDVAHRLSSARGACRITLERTVYDPAALQLEPGSTWPIHENKDGSIRTMPHGRAKNAFGAYMFGVWDCTVRPEGDNIRVLSLKQIPSLPTP